MHSLNSAYSSMPPTLNHIVGQQNAVEQAKIALDAAFAESEAFPHTLLVGPPGLGKSLLAQVLSREMASGYQEVLGQSLTCPAEMNAVLLSATDKSILFIDECEQLGGLQTTLFAAVGERKIYIQSSSHNRIPQAVPLANFTLIMASNHEYQLVQPLRDRMRLVLRFDYYSTEELIEILRQRIRSLRWSIEETTLSQIASRGRGTPRIAIRLIESCRRVARSEGETTILPKHLLRTCELEGIDSVGLDRQEICLLNILNDAGRPVRLSVLALRMGLPSRTISDVIEQYLIRMGLIQRTDEGRLITSEGIRHLRNPQLEIVGSR